MTKLTGFLYGVLMLIAANTFGHEAAHDISIKTDAKEVVVGNPLHVRVRYSNRTITPWTLVQPDRALSVTVYHQVRGGLDTRSSFDMANVVTILQRGPKGERLEAWGAPVEPNVTIAVGKSFDFQFDLAERCLNWQLGDIEIWIEDANENLTSNRVGISIRISQETIPHLLDWATAKLEPFSIPGTFTVEGQRTFWRHAWAVKTLKKLMPGIEWNIIEISNDPDMIAAKTTVNRAAANRFKAEWEKSKDSPEVKARMARLNAGLDEQ